jgi:hypothetical protein
MEEKTFLQKLKNFIKWLLVTIGSVVGIIFTCYQACHIEEACPFLEIDVLKFDVDYRYRSPCEEDRQYSIYKGKILRSDLDYKMEITLKKREDWLTALLPNKENKYVYIFQIEGGRVYRLFPTNKEGKRIFDVNVLKDDSYSLPVKQIDKNTRQTQIYFLSFNARNKELDELYDALQKDSQGTHDSLHTKLKDWLTTSSVPIMTFQYEEKPSCGDKESELHVEVKYSYRSEGESDFKPLHDNAVLYSGDKYKIQFTPSEDSYVYVFQMNTDNQKIYTLFPCTEEFRIEQNQNPFSANTTYYLPNEKQHWKLEEPLGFEKIYFLAFKTNHDLKSEYQQIEQACKQPDSENWVLKSLNLQDKGVFSNTLTFKHQ